MKKSHNIIKHPVCKKYKKIANKKTKKVLDETRDLNPKHLITIAELPNGNMEFNYTYSNRSKVIACLELIKYNLLINNDANEILNGKNFQEISNKL